MNITHFQLDEDKCIGCGTYSALPVGRPELRYPRGVQRQGCARLQRPVIPEMI